MNLFKKQIIFLTILFLISCHSEYGSALKSVDAKEIMTLANKYYNAKKYNKANDLLAHLTPIVAGTPDAKEAMLLGAKIAFNDRNYIVASSRYKSYYDQQARQDSMRETSLFMAAKSSYLASPAYNLDQSGTNEAIELTQEFINKYPNSKYLSEANDYIKEMRTKLEKKAYMAAYGYYKMGNYRSASEALKYFVEDYPDSQYRELAYIDLIRSKAEIGLNSIEDLKKTRLVEAINVCKRMKVLYPNSIYSVECEKIYKKLTEELAKFS